MFEFNVRLRGDYGIAVNGTASLSGERRQPAEHEFRRQAADECRLAACAPQKFHGAIGNHDLLNKHA